MLVDLIASRGVASYIKSSLWSRDVALVTAGCPAPLLRLLLERPLLDEEEDDALLEACSCACTSSSRRIIASTGSSCRTMWVILMLASAQSPNAKNEPIVIIMVPCTVCMPGTMTA